jgi:hypothetical protein
MNKLTCLFFSFLLLISCQDTDRDVQTKTLFTAKVSSKQLLNKVGNTIKTRFNLPTGFTRIQPKENSFASYLQNFKLKPNDAKVHLYNGELKNRQDVHVAVLDIDVGKRDLQQCADATMRLRAEYLYQQKEFDKISFNFTNDHKVNYSKWRQGYRMKVKGNKTSWYKTNKESISYQSFRQYLELIFTYAGTLSLDKELPSVSLKNLKIGNIFIQGGRPGHAIIVVDMAVNDQGEKIFLLAQSFMPAQEIHILKNLSNRSLSPWYTSKNLDKLITPEWTFSKDDIKRFR